MALKYVVIDEEGLTSWNDDGDNAEGFDTFDEATDRAKTLAKVNAGSSFYVYALTATVECEVVEPTVKPYTQEK